MSLYRTRDLPSGEIHEHTSMKRRDDFVQERRPGVIAIQILDHLPVVDVSILDAEGYAAWLEETASKGAA